MIDFDIHHTANVIYVLLIRNSEHYLAIIPYDSKSIKTTILSISELDNYVYKLEGEYKNVKSIISYDRFFLLKSENPEALIFHQNSFNRKLYRSLGLGEPLLPEKEKSLIESPLIIPMIVLTLFTIGLIYYWIKRVYYQEKPKTKE